MVSVLVLPAVALLTLSTLTMEHTTPLQTQYNGVHAQPPAYTMNLHH